MDMNSNYNQPEDEIEDPANQEDYPDTDGLDAGDDLDAEDDDLDAEDDDLDIEDDDEDIDIDTTDSDEIPDGDDVDLERAE